MSGGRFLATFEVPVPRILDLAKMREILGDAAQDVSTPLTLRFPKDES